MAIAQRAVVGRNHRYSDAAPSGRVGLATAAADESSAGREDASFNSMRAPRSELNDRPARSSGGHSRRLAGDECLQVDNGKQAGLYELGLRDRSSHAQQRFAGEEDRALGQCPDVASEPESRKQFKQAAVNMPKQRKRAEIGNIFRREMNISQKIKRLLQACRDQIVAMRWQVANE